MVLAAHSTPVRGLVATTVETVRFTRPDRVDFRLLRCPVPEVIEAFLLTEHDEITRLEYRSHGTDLWGAGAWWGGLVARRWEHVVATSLTGGKTEAERRAHR
jgi:hypothetical protein